MADTIQLDTIKRTGFKLEIRINVLYHYYLQLVVT